MYKYITSQEELDFYISKNPSFKPKFNFSDKLSLYKDALELHINYAIFNDYEEHLKNIEYLVTNSIKLRITDIAIFIPDRIEYDNKKTIYYRFVESDAFISEPCFYISGFKDIYMFEKNLIY